MPRKLRVQYPGAIYHLMNRGDYQEPIFRDDKNRGRFIGTLEECCQKARWQVHALCLMSNHFHLVVETPVPNLVEGMRWLLGVFTARFNRRHNLLGHLFGSRYKALLVDGSGNGYLKVVGDYVGVNPVRAGLIGSEERIESYLHGAYKLSGEQRTFRNLLNREGVLNLEYLKWSKRCTPPSGTSAG